MVSEKKNFHDSPHISLCSICPRRGLFLPPGYNLNKLGRGSLGDASYQMSRLYAVLFRTRIFFHVSPWEGPFLAQGHNLNKPGRGPLGDATYRMSRL